ncbi:MAG: DUF1566 domain-containing protein, partial [Spirochaetes bacterium]|nr:DUF1566 domain-containing protein [Spirochaetota bacterium]
MKVRKKLVFSLFILFLTLSIVKFYHDAELKAGVFTKGRILYKSSGMEKEDKEKVGIVKMDQGTAVIDATEGKVLVNYEFWTADGKRLIGTFIPANPAHVQQGVRYGANGTEFTGALEMKYLPQRTGQITSYTQNDDGDLRKGYTGGFTNADGSWNGSTRFIINGDGTATDNLTGLMWTTNGNIYGQRVWNFAVTNSKNCSVGGYNDWRLPNTRELLSLVDYGKNNPALPLGNPFNVQSDSYWTGTT